MARKKSDTDNIDKKRKVSRKDLQKTLKIFRFVLPYKGTFILGLIVLLFSTITTLVFPYFTGDLLDTAIKPDSQALKLSINEIALILIGILILQALFSFLRVSLFVKVSENTMRDVRLTLYQKIISLPLAFFEKKRVGELISRVTSDVTQMQEVISFTLAEFLRQLVTFILGVGFLLVLYPRLTLVMLLTFPLLIGVAIVFGRYIRKLSKKTQDSLADSNVIVEETFQSIQSVKSFTNENYEIARYRLQLNKVMRIALRAGQFRGAFVSFIIFGLFGALVIVLWYGVNLIAAGKMSFGDLTTFVIYTFFIGGALATIGDIYAQLQRTIGASERILEILEEEEEVKTNIRAKANLEEQNSHQLARVNGNIAFQEVHFAYPTRPDLEVLKGISLTIAQGQKIALVGYSGAGKSTIVQLLGRYYNLSKGQILVDDKNIQDYNISDLRSNIGTVPQEVILFGGTIKENISYGQPGASEEEIIEAAKQANAWKFIETFPEKLETLVGERGVKLSGGQRQRIAIARAILKNPSILILDEATSSLDADSEKLVQEALDELMKNRTTIIIAHRLATIRKVDKIYVIDGGTIIESGTHEELSVLENGLYSSLVKLQFANELEV